MPPWGTGFPVGDQRPAGAALWPDGLRRAFWGLCLQWGWTRAEEVPPPKLHGWCTRGPILGLGQAVSESSRAVGATTLGPPPPKQGQLKRCPPPPVWLDSPPGFSGGGTGCNIVPPAPHTSASRGCFSQSPFLMYVVAVVSGGGWGFHHPTQKKQGPPGSLGLSPFVFTYKTESISAKLHQNSSAALLIVLHSFAGYF